MAGEGGQPQEVLACFKGEGVGQGVGGGGGGGLGEGWGCNNHLSRSQYNLSSF